MVAIQREIIAIDVESVDDYPLYTAEEKLADAIIHAVGIVASLFACGWLWGIGFANFHTGLGIAVALYAVLVIALFMCSCAYHHTPVETLRPFLRRLDQSAIFFKIAGTYTPLVFIIGTTFGFSVLAFVWSCAVLGAAFKMFTGERLSRYTVSMYLALSWASLLLIWPMYHALPGLSLTLIALGGITYTTGVYFHQASGMHFNNAIWHAFVVAGSAMHYTAIGIAASAFLTA
ncbi:MAG: hemolysin III family protein [Pseudomonadota bacterium]